MIVKSRTADKAVTSSEVILTETGKAESATLPNFYAVMVGVSDYKGKELDLIYAAKDAADISKVLAVASRKLLNTIVPILYLFII